MSVILLTLAALLVTLALPRVQAITNLLVNPGFEDATDGTLTGWSTFPDASLAQVSSPSRFGFAAAFTNRATGGMRFYQSVGAQAGARYTLAAWCLKNDLNVASVWLEVEWLPGGGSPPASTRLWENLPEFQAMTLSALAPPGTTGLRAEVWSLPVTGTGTPGVVICDELSLTAEAPLATPTRTATPTATSAGAGGPAATSTATPSKTPSPLATASSTATSAPTGTSTPTVTATLLATASSTATSAPTRSSTPTLTSTPPAPRTATPTRTPGPPATYVASGSVVINEVMVDPVEWVELLNTTGESLILAGWSVEDNTEADALPPLTLPPFGFAVLSGATSMNLPAGVPLARPEDGRIGNGLANTADLLQLRDPGGRIMDELSWGDPSGCPAPRRGRSLQRAPGGCGFEETPAPSPGLPNTPHLGRNVFFPWIAGTGR